MTRKSAKILRGSQANKKQGPGSIRHRGGKCIHFFTHTFKRPKEGEFLVTSRGCRKDRLEFQLWPNGTLMLTKYGMCVKPTGPVTDGGKVGIFSMRSCDATDTWSWTAQGSLRYKKKMCLKPETGGEDPRNDVYLVLDSVCDEQQNVLKFVPTSGWYLHIEASRPRRRNDKARLISPWTTETKSCLLFFYHMFGADVGKLQVYVKSEGKGKMYSMWSLSGDQGHGWYQAEVAVNNQTTSYQYVIEGVRGKSTKGDIAIDDISLMVSCPPRDSKPMVNNNGSKKVPTSFTVSTTPAILPSQTSSEVEGATDDSSKIITTATIVAAGVFLSIVLNVLLVKYKRRASKLSTPGNFPLEILPEPLPVDEEPFYETVGEFYDDAGTSGNKCEDPSSEDSVGVPSNGDKTFEYTAPVGNEHQWSGHEIGARVNRGFYEDVATNANESEEISPEGRTSDHKEVEAPSNAQKASGNTELNKPPDTSKRGATGDGDYRAFLKEFDIIDIYVIPVPEEPQHETPGQNETCEEPKLSPENPVYTEFDVNGDHAKQGSDYVIPAQERRESYEDIKMGRNLPDYTELDQSKRESEV